MARICMLAGGGIMMGALFLLPVTTPAEQGTPAAAAGQGAKPARVKGMQAGNAERRLQHLSAQLNLTEEQKKQILPILQDETAKVEGLRDNEKVSRVERRAKLQDIRDEMYDRINNVLTPEQKKKHEELRKQAQERRKR